MARSFLRKIQDHINLHWCPRTGIAWVENGKVGCSHSAHPNIDATGSVRGMKNRGYWKKDARTVRTNGYIYNIDSLVVTDEYDQIAADNCTCSACVERRRGMLE